MKPTYIILLIVGLGLVCCGNVAYFSAKSSESLPITRTLSTTYAKQSLFGATIGVSTNQSKPGTVMTQSPKPKKSENAATLESGYGALSKADIPPNPTNSKYPIIVLDPGHGTRDSSGAITGNGSVGVYGEKQIQEHTITLDYAMWLMASLRNQGFVVYSTRTYERPWFDVSYQGHNQEKNNKLRADFAAEKKAELFIRIHFDGSQNKSQSGYSLWYGDQSKYDTDGSIAKNSKLAATTIEKPLAKVMSIPDLGVKRFTRPIYGFVYAKQAAVLLELGFLTNPHDVNYLLKCGTAKTISDAIAKSIQTYFDSNQELLSD